MNNPLPREIAPGVFWLGGCLETPFEGRDLHGYNSVYLVSGDDCSVLVEGGHPKDLAVIESQLEQLLASGVPSLRYAFVTHTETPHSSGLGRILGHFPDVTAVGSLLDAHLVFPQYEDRMMMLDPGDSLNLGGRTFRVVEAVIRDMPYTRWGFDEQQRVLFPGDGFAFCHYHEDGHCGLTAEEALSLDVVGQVSLFADLALYWTKFVDVDPYVEQLELMLNDLDVKVIGPTHGLPLADVVQTLPDIRAGFKMGSTSESAGLLDG